MLLQKRRSIVKFNHGVIHFKNSDNLEPGAFGNKNGRETEDQILYNFLMENFDSLIMENKIFQEVYKPSMTTGASLRAFGIKEKIVIVPQFQSSYRLDFLLINTVTGHQMGIEVRFYGGKGGSLEQRIHAWFSSAMESRVKSILIFAGSGWSDDYIARAKKDIKRMHVGKYVKGIFNYETEPKMILREIRKHLRLK